MFEKALARGAKRYDQPLVVRLPAVLKTQAFDGDRPLAAPVERRLDAVTLRHKVSQELKTCTNKLVISLEDDAPATGPRATFLIDIMNPCWVWPQADLTGVVSLSAQVGQVPFNFQIGADRAKIALRPPQTPEGELEVRLDTCDGERIAAIPLASAAGSQAVSTITGAMAGHVGRHDLCLTFTGKGIDPMWAIDQLQLNPVGA